MESAHTVYKPFPPTRWTLVSKASSAETQERCVALEELCRLYWPPVYAFIRSKGSSPEEAEDLTQGFFAEFLERQNFSQADDKRGKLRSYLLKSVSNFMARNYRNQTRQKRGGKARVLSLDMTDEEGNAILLEPEDGVTPESIFEKQWALTVLRQVFDQLQRRYREKNQTEIFESLRFVISSEEEGESYSQIATRLDMKENAVKVAAHRLRERYGIALREIIADTLAPDHNIDEEIRELMKVFS